MLALDGDVAVEELSTSVSGGGGEAIFAHSTAHRSGDVDPVNMRFGGAVCVWGRLAAETSQDNDGRAASSHGLPGCISMMK